MGHKWVRRSKILSGLNLNMVLWDPVQKQENFVFEGHQSTFWIKMTFGIGHPPPIHQLQSTCVGEGSRVPNLQTEFNYLDSFKTMAFLVISLSPWSPCCPHIIPVIPTSSPHHPHSPQKVPMWSPWLWCPLSPWSPPYVVPTSSPCHPRIVPIAPRRSPCGPHGCGVRCLRGLHPMLSPWSPCCPRCPHIVPIVPVSSPLSPHRLEDPHIIPNPPDTHSTHPYPPGGVGGPKSVKMQ